VAFRKTASYALYFNLRLLPLNIQVVPNCLIYGLTLVSYEGQYSSPHILWRVLLIDLLFSRLYHIIPSQPISQTMARVTARLLKYTSTERNNNPP